MAVAQVQWMVSPSGSVLEVSLDQVSTAIGLGYKPLGSPAEYGAPDPVYGTASGQVGKAPQEPTLVEKTKAAGLPLPVKSGQTGDTFYNASGVKVSATDPTAAFRKDASGKYYPYSATATGEKTTTGGTTMPVTPGLEEFLLTPEQLRARYEQAYNIPAAGQTPYHKWLAQQWALPSMSYGLAAQGLGGAAPYTGSYENFLASYGSPARVPAQYANQFMALSPQEQAQMAELTGFNQRDVEAMAATGRLQQTYAPWAASARVGQMMSPTAERRFGLTTGAATGEDTFLNYLRTKYGF